MTGFVFKVPLWCRPRVLVAALIVLGLWSVVGLVVAVVLYLPSDGPPGAGFDFLVLTLALSAAVLGTRRVFER